MAMVQQKPKKRENNSSGSDIWSNFLKFAVQVLNTVKKDRNLAILWGFGVLFVFVYMFTVTMAGLSPTMKFGFAVIIILALIILFVYTVRGMPRNSSQKEEKTSEKKKEKPRNSFNIPGFRPPLFEEKQFVVRQDKCEQLINYFIGADQKNRTYTTIALCGADGFGKTTLATALCHNNKIKKRFNDRILWLELGDKPDVLGKLITLHSGLMGEKPEYAHIDYIADKVAKELEDRKCLIVIDDMQNYDMQDSMSLKPFLEKSKNCDRIIATSNLNVVSNIANEWVDVNDIKQEEAVQMLIKRLDPQPSNLKPFQELAEDLGRMPLMLDLAGAHLWQHMTYDKMTPDEAISDLKQTLYKKGILYMCRYKNKNEAINQFIEYNLNLIDQAKGNHYIEMAILPEDIDIPLSTVNILWRLNDPGETKELCEDLRNLSLLKYNWKTETIRLHKVFRCYLSCRVSNPVSLHERMAKGLLTEWEKRGQETENDPVIEYALKYMLWHMIEGQSWDELKKLLTDIEYLKAKQDPAEQYNFHRDFKDLLNNKKVGIGELVNILEEVLNVISEKLKIGNEKADWLDIFSWWIYEFSETDYAERKAALKKVARKFDYACADVARDLAYRYLKEGKNDWALRFAELATWVYQRTEDYSKSVEACKSAEEICLQEGMHTAYRGLLRTEFIRMRARALSVLARTETDENVQKQYDAQAGKAYEELNEVFAPEQKNGWELKVEDWKQLEKLDNEILIPPPIPAIDRGKSFKVKVVSNVHDSISAIYIIRFLEAYGCTVGWEHPKRFRPNEKTLKDFRFVIIIGGPKAPGMFNLVSMFYEGNKKGFLKIYSAKEMVDCILKIEQDNMLYYWVAGPSKPNTIMAAYKLTQDQDFINIIKH